MLAAVFYMLGIWSSDVMVPLLNAVSVAYNNAGYSVNYGVARGIGAVASAVSSLVIGWVIAKIWHNMDVRQVILPVVSF